MSFPTLLIDSFSPCGSILLMASFAAGVASGGTNFSASALQCASTYCFSKTDVIWRSGSNSEGFRVSSHSTTPYSAKGVDTEM